jgi:hypothetical protein
MRFSMTKVVFSQCLSGKIMVTTIDGGTNLVSVDPQSGRVLGARKAGSEQGRLRHLRKQHAGPARCDHGG